MNTVSEILVPDIGDFSNVPIVEIPVSAGDYVNEGDTLIVIESDKATLDVPAAAEGKVIDLKVSVNDLVSQGSIVMTMEVAEAPAQDTEAEATHPAPAPKSAEPQPPFPPDETNHFTDTPLPSQTTHFQTTHTEKCSQATIYASPSVRRYARQLGVPIDSVTGTGLKERVTRKDIEHFVKAVLTSGTTGNNSNSLGAGNFPDWPAVDYEKYGPVERMPVSRISKIAGPALARNAAFIPHVTNFDKTDITELAAFRKSINEEAGSNNDRPKLSLLAFTVKAVVSALKDYPKFNSSLDDQELVCKNYWNIGIATNTEDGLMVPVIKDADKKGLFEIVNDIANLAHSARNGALKPTDMQGATFTISSLGGIGGTNFTPIINAPEVAILGMTRSELQPVWDGSEFQPRLIQPLSLSWDHRVVDGVEAAHFLKHIGHVLNDFKRVSL